MLIERESPANVGESGLNLVASTHVQRLYWKVLKFVKTSAHNFIIATVVSTPAVCVDCLFFNNMYSNVYSKSFHTPRLKAFHFTIHFFSIRRSIKASTLFTSGSF